MKVVLDSLAEYRKMGEGDLQELLNMKRICTYLGARQMMEQRLIEGRGRGASEFFFRIDLSSIWMV